MDEEFEKIKNKIKSVTKSVLKKIVIKLLPVILIIIILASFVYYIEVWVDGKGDDDWSGASYAAGQYTSNIAVNANGEMTGSISAQELWDKMIENGSRVNLYLDEPAELLKLMNAEMITQYIDTRSNPDDEINWEKINNTESANMQGIIKLKRSSDESGNKTTMIYADPDTFQSYIDEYNLSGSEDAKKNALNHFTLEKTYVANSSTASAISAGTAIEIPEGLGSVHTYMGWQIITSTTSTQYKLREQAGMAFDEEGFGKINGRYVIACTTTFGAVGDYIDFYQVDGTIIPCIIGDIKSQGDAGCNQYGHNNGRCIVEFIVDKSTWYSGGSGSHANPGNTNCHPEWNQNIIKAVNGGSYFENATFGAENITDGGTTVAAATEVKYNALVATWTESTEKIERGNPKDPDVEEKSNTVYNMTTTKVNYKELVSGYTMPFDYLWSMLVITEDKDFVMQLADLVYNSKIEITVYDNLTTNTNVNVYTYTKKEKTNTNATVKVTGKKGSGDSKVTTTRSRSGSWSYEDTTDYQVIYTNIIKTNTLDVAVTLADVWMAKYTKSYENQVPDDIVTPTSNTLEDIDYPTEPSKQGNNDTYGHAKDLIKTVKQGMKEDGYSSLSGSIHSISEDIYIGYINRKENITNTTHTSKYVCTSTEVKEKVDKDSEEPNFVTIFLDPNNLKAKNNILSVTSWLFELLENHDSTKDTMVDLTKYLLYKATGTDYGVTEYDFNIFYISEFKDTNYSESGMNLLKEYIHYWEHSSPPPTNADGTKYIIEDDGNGHPTVGYGVDIINGGFQQEFISAGYSTSIGGEVDKEFVDSLEERKIQEYIDYIKNITSGLNLNEYQIYALVSRAYEFGKGDIVVTKRGSQNLDFISSYKSYWNDGDDKFESKDKNADFNHALYVNYMSETVNVEDNEKALKSEKRRKSEWTLFQTGYFDVLGKWYEAASMSEGGISTEEERANLQNYIETELIHTKVHKNYEYQNGPFAKWWNAGYNNLSPFQCTWWANGRASMYLEKYGTKYKKYPTQSGNGGDYYQKNINGGWFNYGSMPKANSIISWRKTGGYGHVAYVEGVTSDGIYISEAGSGKSWYGVTKIPLDGSRFSGYILNGYIYLDEPK